MFIFIRITKRLIEESAKLYAAQVLLGLEYMHKNHIIYRDLKPENVLINANGYLTLIDFGYAKFLQGKTSIQLGTAEYMAPEIILGNDYDNSIDQWAFGILIYEMMVGIDPFSEKGARDTQQIMNNALSDEIKFHPAFPKIAKQLVKSLLSKKSRARLGSKSGISAIKNHMWFKNIDFSKLVNLKVKPYYKPKLKSKSDIKCQHKFTDDEFAPEIKSNDDPFLDW